MGINSKGNKNRSAARDYIEKPNIEHMDVHVYHERKYIYRPNLLPCPECGLEGLSANAELCPGCQAPLGEYRRHIIAQECYRARLKKSSLYLLLLGFGVLLGSYFLPETAILGQMTAFITRGVVGFSWLASSALYIKSLWL